MALFLPLLTLGAQQPGRELHIAAAADLQPVLPELARAYEHASGVHVIASFGSSATLATQILAGAPQDVFLSADREQPQLLVERGASRSPAPVPYARGVLVLWQRNGGPLQPLRLEDLTNARVQRIAVANDRHAPYGKAATAALTALHLYDTLKPRLIVAENIGQAAQFAETGNADLGLISLTIASSPRFRSEGTFVRMPAVYPSIVQCGVVLKNAHDSAAADAFLRWLTSPEVQKQLPTFGLEPAR